MNIPQPKTVKEAAAILATVKANSLAFKKSAEDPWYSFPGALRRIDTASNAAADVIGAAATGALDKARDGINYFKGHFSDPSNALGISPLGQTVAGGLAGGAVGGLTGLTTGLSRKNKRPLRDMLTGIGLGGLTGAGLGAAYGYGHKALYDTGEGASRAGLDAGAKAIEEAKAHNATYAIARPIASLARAPGDTLSRAGTKVLDPNMADETWAGAAGGGTYLGVKGYKGLRNLVAKYKGLDDNRGWRALASTMSEPTAKGMPASPGAGIGKPKSIPYQLAQRLSTGKEIFADEMNNMLNTLGRKGGGLSNKQMIELRKVLAGVGVNAPTRAKILNVIKNHGLGNLNANELQRQMNTAVKTRYGAKPTVRGFGASVLAPMAITRGIKTLTDSAALRDELEAFVKAQPSSIQGNGPMLAKAYKKMIEEQANASGGNPQVSPAIIDRLMNWGK